MKTKLSLINSVSASGLADTPELVKELQLRYVDLYAFMNEDLKLLWPTSRVEYGFPRNALYEMAKAADFPDDLPRIGQIIEDKIGPAKVAAFATYLPEITSPDSNPYAAVAAQNALKFVIQLADELRRRGHPVDTIETVGGSTVDGLWRGKTKRGNKTYVVNLLDEALSITRLVNNLKPVVDFAIKTGSNVRLAVELEPGPLFNLYNKESLLKLCYLIDSMGDNFRKVVGLNLDIPHWCFLSNISPAWVVEHPLVLQSIVHAHISDHSRGHFCDLETFLFHGSSELVPWLRLLMNLGSDQKKFPKYSNFLACEMECCSDINSVRRSLKYLQELLDREVTSKD